MLGLGLRQLYGWYLFALLSVIAPVISQANNLVKSSDTFVSENPLILNQLKSHNAENRFNLSEHIFYLNDANRNLDATAVFKLIHDAPGRFDQLGSSAFSSGFKKGWHWFVIPVSNHSSQALWWLALEQSVNQVEVFALDTDGALIGQALTGGGFGFEQRLVYHREIIIPLNIAQTSQQFWLIKLDQFDYPVRTRFELGIPEHIVEPINKRAIIIGLLIGVMSIMAIYNFVIFIMTKDRAYFFYVVMTLCFVMHYSITHGLDLFVSSSADRSNYLIPCLLFLCLGMIFLLAFSREFLRLASRQPFCNTVFSFLQFLIAITAIGLLVSDAKALFMLLVVLVLITSVLIFTVGIRSFISAWLPGRIFLVGATIYLLGFVVLMLETLGVTAPMSYTLLIPMAGHAVEAVCLSLALAMKIRILQQKNLELEQKNKQALMDANEKLEQSHLIKDHFLNAVSHELRTPMYGVLGNLDLINEAREQAPKPSLQQDFIEQDLIFSCHYSALRMARMIDTILDFTDLQQGNCLNRPCKVKLADIQQFFEHYLHDETYSKGLEFSIEVSCALKQGLILDWSLLQKACRQLVENAIKFTHIGAIKVIIDLDTLDKENLHTLTIRVIDSGIGINQDQVEEIFIPFEQQDQGLRRNYSGIGIGLPLAAQLIELMQGSLELEYSSPKGSCFTLSVPVTQYDEQTPVSQMLIQAEQQAQDNQQACWVLIVEDETTNQIVLERMCARLGMRTQLAENGEQALAMLDDKPWQFILMDCQMPVMDGLTCCEQIRKRGGDYQRLPIIAVSANTELEGKQACMQVGMTAFYAKPLRLWQLKQIYKSWGQSNIYI